MKNIFNTMMLSLVVLFLMSCNEDQNQDGFSKGLHISGPSGGAIGKTGSYTTGNTEGTTWATSDEAVVSIISTAGDSVKVSYNKTGSARLTATVGSLTGWVDITIGAGDPASVVVIYNKHGILANDSSGTITFTFEGELTKIPTLTMIDSDTTFESGSLGDVELDSATKYTVLYTAGLGNGIPRGVFDKIILTKQYGGDTTMKNLEVGLFEVDNLPPYVVKRKISPAWVKAGGKVTIEIEFSEAMRGTMTTKADTTVWLVIGSERKKAPSANEFVYDRVALAGSKDLKTWSLTYTVPDSLADDKSLYSGTIDGQTSNDHIIGKLLDVAGNEVLGEIAMNGDVMAKSDATRPLIDESDVLTPWYYSGARAAGTGLVYVAVGASASDGSGSGIGEMHYVIKKTWTVDSVAGPSSLADFGSGMFSGGGTVEAGSSEYKGFHAMSTDSASYDLFWIATDKVGLESKTTTGMPDSITFNIYNGVITRR